MATLSRQALRACRSTITNISSRNVQTFSGSTRVSILPWVLGTVTAACAATGAAAYYNSKSSVFSQQCAFMEVVKASPPEQKMASERSFIMIKPDGVARGLVADIINRFEQRGYKLVAMKFMQADKDLLENHYGDLKDKKFFPGLIKFIGSGPVVPMVWEGKDVVKQGRSMLGETDPLKSKPGSIRGDYCIDMGRNIIHGSDSVDSANKEIALWFKPGELVDWKSPLAGQVYE